MQSPNWVFKGIDSRYEEPLTPLQRKEETAYVYSHASPERETDGGSPVPTGLCPVRSPRSRVRFPARTVFPSQGAGTGQPVGLRDGGEGWGGGCPRRSAWLRAQRNRGHSAGQRPD